MLMNNEVDGYVKYYNLQNFINALGISESLFFRTVNLFIKEGIIAKEKGKFKILNKEKLKEFYDQYIYDF